MLSDFDLSKNIGDAGGAAPLMTFNHVTGVPMLDTRACLAAFRTNSFVGTEGKRTALVTA